MNVRRLSAALLATIALAGSQALGALTIGDAAPPLTVGKWVKGEPVKELEKGKLYVVEFWATWCGPCIQSIPHITEMAKANPEVTFIGTSVWENDDADVDPFIVKMGDKMEYHVAVDDKSSIAKGAMATGWMEAAGQNGIPTAFIIGKDGKIAWIGHPMEMEPVLKQVVAGTFNTEEGKKLADKKNAEKEAAQKIQNELQTRLTPALKSGDFDAAVKVIDEIAAANPEAKANLIRVKWSVLLRGKQYDMAYKAADELAAIHNDDPQSLNELAWTIVDGKGIEKRDLDRALKIANRADELTEHKSAEVLDTLARVHFEKGDVAKAIEIETTAVGFATGELKTELQKTLDKYTAAKK